MRFLRPSALLAGTSVMVLGVVLGGHAHAADCAAAASTCIDSDVLWPVAGPSTFFSVGSAQTVGKGRFGFGLASSFQRNPIVLRKSASGPAGPVAVSGIENQLNTSFVFAYGVTEKLEVALVTPVTFYQSGTGISAKDGATTPIDQPSNGVRDLRIGAAYSIIGLPRAGQVRGVGLAARFDLSIPTGDRDAFGGDRSVVAVPGLIVDNRLGPFTVGAQVGARLRQTTTLFDRKVSSQLFLGLGVAAAVDKKETLAITAEAFALPALAKDGTSPIQWLAGVRWAGLAGGDFTIHGGAGGGFRGAGTAQLLEPSWRAVLDLRYSPLLLDRDGDGIPDREDKCPDEKEDRDGFQDDDGCPDKDNDNDGIPDKDDRCPMEPEEVNGIEDTDGCPEPDKDFDGIKDVVDKCPDKPEDKNGYEDEDGCPEGGPPASSICADGKYPPKGTDKCDSDHDGRSDEVDMCPLVPEDIDGIADDDGCPEKDADEDGVGDGSDKCPLEAETIDGVDDDDGCPEAGAKNQVVFEAGAIEVLKPSRFAAGSAVVTKPMKAQIAMIAQRVQGLVDRGVEKISVESWGDTKGENKANEALASKRAEGIAAALVAAGVPEGLIKTRVGDLADPPAKNKANYLIAVKTKRKNALTGKKPEAATATPAAPPAPAALPAKP